MRSLRDIELPLLRRELLGLLRTQRAFWGLVAAVSTSAVVPLALWPESTDVALTAGSVPSLVAAFFVTQLAIVMVVVPVFASQSIATERAEETWDSLLTTQISPTTIVLTKATVALAFVLLLLIATAPALMALELLGGVTGDALGQCYLATGATALLAASCGLAAAAWAERPAAALQESLLLVWISTFFPWPFLLSALFRTTTRFRRCMPHARHWRSSRRSKVRYVFNCFFLLSLSIGAFIAICYLSFPVSRRMSGYGPFNSSPFALFFSLASDSGGRPDSEPFMLSILITVACQLAHVLVAANVGVLSMDESEKAKRLREWGIKIDDPLVRGRRCWLAREVVGMGRRDSGPARNPLFLRELLHEPFGSSRYFRKSLWASALIFLISFPVWRGSNQPSFALRAINLGALFLPALLAAYWGARAIPEERERGSIDLLRGTPLSAREVVQGKLFSALSSAAGLLLGLGTLMISAFVVLFVSTDGWKASTILKALATIPAMLISTTVYGAVASVFSGIVARSTGPALAMSAVLLLLPCALAALPSGPVASLELTGLGFALALAVAAWFLWLASVWIFERSWRIDR